MPATVDPSWRSLAPGAPRRTVGAVTSPAGRGPLALAALASAAVPGLDPVSVEPVAGGTGARYDVALVQDAEHRRWVIRCPRSAAASAQLEQSSALTALLARRLLLSVPVVKGWVALPEGGRAAVHHYLAGRPVELELLGPGPGLTASLGRAVASVHNLDVAIYDEAGAATYDAEVYRSRRLADLDRAAATGRVPTGLLARWESQLEDVGRWRYKPTATVGRLTGEQVLVGEDEQGELVVRGLLGWEDARVADPADDLAEVVGRLEPDALDTFMEAYAHTRVDRPDRHLLERARLSYEMTLVRQMMAAVAAGDLDRAEEHAAAMRRLEQQTGSPDEADDTSAGAPATSGAAPAGASPAAGLADLDDDQQLDDQQLDNLVDEPIHVDVTDVDEVGQTQPMEAGPTGEEPDGSVEPGSGPVRG